MQEKHNSSALAMELRLSCTNPSIWYVVTKNAYFVFILSCLLSKNTISNETKPATSHHLNQWWLVYLHIYASHSLNDLTMVMIMACCLIISWTNINSLWPNDAIWGHRSASTLSQVMACCLTAPSHHLDQCWLIIRKIQLHSSDGNFTRDTSVIND